jgi:hypothetical protein
MKREKRASRATTLAIPASCVHNPARLSLATDPFTLVSSNRRSARTSRTGKMACSSALPFCSPAFQVLARVSVLLARSARPMRGETRSARYRAVLLDFHRVLLDGLFKRFSACSEQNALLRGTPLAASPPAGTPASRHACSSAKEASEASPSRCPEIVLSRRLVAALELPARSPTQAFRVTLRLAAVHRPGLRRSYSAAETLANHVCEGRRGSPSAPARPRSPSSPRHSAER